MSAPTPPVAPVATPDTLRRLARELRADVAAEWRPLDAETDADALDALADRLAALTDLDALTRIVAAVETPHDPWCLSVNLAGRLCNCRRRAALTKLATTLTPAPEAARAAR